MSGEDDLRVRCDGHMEGPRHPACPWLHPHEPHVLRILLATPAEPARESDGAGLRLSDVENGWVTVLWDRNGRRGRLAEAKRDLERIIAARVAEAGARALEEAADEMEFVIAEGDVAEVAAPVQGERGRGAVVARRDALYEEPHTWLRDRARGLRS